MFDEVISNLESWGYIVLFLYCLYGGYAGIVAAGVLSSMGKMDIGLCILLAFLANTLGSSLTALLARKYKAEIMPHFKKHSRQIALCQLWIRKYGRAAIFISKYIHMVRFITPLAIGISRYDFRAFLIHNALACAVWALLVGFMSYYSGGAIIALFEKFDLPPYALPIALFGWVALMLYAIKLVSRRTKRGLA